MHLENEDLKQKIEDQEKKFSQIIKILFTRQKELERDLKSAMKQGATPSK